MTNILPPVHIEGKDKYCNYCFYRMLFPTTDCILFAQPLKYKNGRILRCQGCLDAELLYKQISELRDYGHIYSRKDFEDKE